MKFTVAFLVLLGGFLVDLARAADRLPPSGAEWIATNAMQVRQSIAESARPVSEARLTGVVTFALAEWEMLFVQDSTGGVFIRFLDLQQPLQPGQTVLVEGSVRPGAYNPFISHARVTVTGQGALPIPARRPIRALATGEDDGHWVEITGTLRSITIENGVEVLHIYEGGDWIKARLRGSNEERWRSLLNAKIRVQGVCAVNANRRREILNVQLFVPDSTFVSVQEPPPKDLFTAPTRRIAEILNSEGVADSTHSIHVRGVVLTNAGDRSFVLQDDSASIRVETSEPHGLKAGAWVEVAGARTRINSMPALNSLALRRIGIVGTNQLARTNLASDTAPVLTTLQHVRELKPEDAAQGRSVRTRGVVTVYFPDWGMMFVQDATAGIYVDAHDHLLDLDIGQWVEMEGRTAPGNFAPIVIQPRFEILGHAPLPPLRPYSAKDLHSGALDSQWLQMSGIVRSVRIQSGHLSMDVVDGSERFEVVIPNFQDKPPPDHLVDASVRIDGVCGTSFNQKRQLMGVRLFAPSLEFVKVDRSAPADPFSVPVRPINSLFQFTSAEEVGHRVHVQGQVTLYRPGELLFVQDESGGLLVQTDQVGAVAIGDRLDVLGFVAPGNYTPVLTQASFRKLDAATPLPPKAVTAEQALSAQFGGDIFDSKLVRLQGRLLESSGRVKDRVLVLQQSNTVFNAHGPNEGANQPASALRIGSLLEVTGVCSVQVDASRSPKSFQIYLRSPADIMVLQEPSWWTARHTLGLAALLAVGVLLTAGWSLALRSRVRAQTQLIQHRFEREKALETRYRDLFENASDLIQSLNPDGSFTYVNPAWLSTLQYSTEEVERLSFRQIVHPKFLDEFERQFQRVLAGEESARFEAVFVSKHGQSITVEGQCHCKIEQGHSVSVRGIFRDVTERKHREEELQRTKVFLNSVVENLPTTVFIKEAQELRFVLWNKAGERLIGFPNSELIGKNDFDFFPQNEAEHFTAKDREALARGQLVDIPEEVIQTRHQGARILRTKKIPICDLSGKPTHLLGISEDITERKQADAQLEKAQRELLDVSRQAGMAEVATGVLHNVGNVLNSVNVSCTLLGDLLKKSKSGNVSKVAALLREHEADLGSFLTVDPKGRQVPGYIGQLAEHLAGEQSVALEELENLRKNIEHIKEIVAMQQSYAKVSGVTETVTITDLIEDCLRMNATAFHRHDVQVLREFDKVPPLDVDKHKVLQILVNLLRNAKYACDQAGRPEKRVTLRVTNGHERVRVAVTDNGVGIAPEHLTRVFAHGFTTKKDGHGFGLHSGALAAKEMGGSLSVQSEGEGRGATFTLELPVSAPRVRSQATHECVKSS